MVTTVDETTTAGNMTEQGQPKTTDNDTNSYSIKRSPDGAVNHSPGGNSSGDIRYSCPDAPLGPPAAPDGGYGWVILCASFCINVIVDGVCFSFGIFFLEFLDHFNEGKETTSWVGSVLNGMYLTMGPVVGALANKFGCRSVTIVGSVLASGSLILSTFSPNINVLIITYGLLTGAGFGLMYLPAIVMVGYYFEKRRAFATGIAVCGSGIGAFLFAPLCEKLIEMYSWTGATWIIAGLCLNGVVCGALFRPLEVVPSKRGRTIVVKKEISEQVKPVSGTETSSDHKDTIIHKYKVLPQSLSGAMVKSMQNLPSSCEEEPCLSRSCDDMRMYKELTDAEIRQFIHDLKRPMYRKDILYRGSVQQLPEYQESGNMDTYLRSITAIPAERTPRHKGTCSKIKKTCKSLTDTFKEMMDFTVLRQPVFCIYGLSCFLCMAGFFVPFIYLPDVAITFGMSRDQAAFLISIIGIANTIARVLCGWVSDQSWADCLIINNCALVIGGVATILCPFCFSYPLLAIYSFVFGSCIAAFVSLRSIIMVELMGLDKLTSAFGLVTFCQGLSAFIGAPIAGALFDATGYYNLSFYVAGSTLAMAGIICFPLRRVAAWWSRRTLQKEQNGSTVEGCDYMRSCDGDIVQINGNVNTTSGKV